KGETEPVVLESRPSPEKLYLLGAGESGLEQVQLLRARAALEHDGLGLAFFGVIFEERRARDRAAVEAQLQVEHVGPHPDRGRRSELRRRLTARLSSRRSGGLSRCRG